MFLRRSSFHVIARYLGIVVVLHSSATLCYHVVSDRRTHRALPARQRCTRLRRIASVLPSTAARTFNHTGSSLRCCINTFYHYMNRTSCQPPSPTPTGKLYHAHQVLRRLIYYYISIIYRSIHCINLRHQHQSNVLNIISVVQLNRFLPYIHELLPFTFSFSHTYFCLLLAATAFFYFVSDV